MQRHVDSREAEEIVRLATAREATAPADGPTVEGLAEALNLPVSEVERLLAQVRGRTVPALSARRFGDRSAALSAAIVLALVVTLAGIRGASWYTHRPPAFDVGPVATVASPAPGSLEVGGDTIIHLDGTEGQVTVPVAPAPPAPLVFSRGITQTQEELKGNADVVRHATENVAKLSPSRRKEQYEPLMDTIQGQREIAAEIRRKAPAHRTAGERDLLQAVAAYDRLFETSAEG